MRRKEIDPAVKKLNKLKKFTTDPIDRFEQLHAEGKLPKHNNEVVGLQVWHMELIKDRIIDGMEYGELAKKYDCTREWASAICRSEVGIAYGKELIEKFDIQAVRKTFQMLTAPAMMPIRRVIQGRNDGIDELERAKFCLEVAKAGGLASPKEHKFQFEHIFKDAADRLEENERRIAGEVSKEATKQVMNQEIKQIVLDAELEDAD